mgnify:CR=1 FL=1
MHLSDDELREIRRAIITAYKYKREALKTISMKLDKSLIDIAEKETDIKDIVKHLIKWAKLNNQLEKLIQEIYKDCPHEKDLKNIKQKYCPDLSDGVPNKNNLFADLNEEWDILCCLLKEINDLELITQICIITLQNNNIDVSAHHPELNQTIENLDIIKTILIEKHPIKQNDVPTVLEFAERLKDKVKINQKNKISNWIKAVKQKISITTEIYQPEPKSSKIVESYLMIIVTPSNINTDKFYLSAELVADNLPDNKIIEQKNQSAIECSLNQLASNIYKFIGIAKRRYLHRIKHDLTIEVFLPSNLLYETIELQDIPISKNKTKPIGNEYKFIVRSLERLTEFNEEYLNKLYIKWDELQNKLNANIDDSEIKNIFYNLTQIDNLDLDTIEEKIEDKLGMKITCSLPNNLKKGDIGDICFHTIVRGGIPIALWLKSSNIANVNINKEFDEILKISNLKNLQDLFISIKKIRREAYKQGNNAKNYLGYHLGFLCDNPDRIPSCFSEEPDFFPTGE